ncbi:hemin ABC transporter substrate-binding protein [Flavobacterium arcticum]|uniref:Hemin ABC transporter substrate-binding protein n=1 Tax=Flavobacterium arcticum TaxID=1784713 RepID=A0A345HAL3_9FLAO|nr:ABC transporter substrate-binding protein [Flavobacterium arcticum]AXG73623.1 hemin ABC transporter substrate-binding protein [Flavobacterium arcticum]KAF2511573.1 ABC transporter substrate-binding protein [Flavobacterium arcticum]
MKHLIKTVTVALVLLATVSCKKEQKQTEENTVANDTVAKTEQRIISLNGALTEMVSALGHQDEIVGVDVTSTYPEQLKESAQNLGHTSKISIESIMALQPTLVLATREGISPELIEKIELSGITTYVFEREFSPYGAKKTVAEVADILDSKNVKEVQDKIDADLAKIVPLEKAQKVLFIYAGHGPLMVSGKNTPVDKVITLAGGTNAIEGFDDYKPLTPEALVKGNPDVILMFNSGLASLSGIDGVLKIQGIAETNAGKNKNVIAMDGGLLAGFGPRLGEAALELNSKLSENK